MKLQMTEAKGRSNQFFFYMPKRVVEAMGWEKGTPLTVKVLGKGELKVEKVDVA